jgi:peptide/nickel transport system ATP-binding protein
MSAPAVLSVRHLSVDFVTPAGLVRGVDDVSFEVRANEVLCLVGESGSGKSVTLLAAMRLLPPSARVASGEVHFKGQDLRTLSDRALRDLRGCDLAMVFQDPLTALNPVMTIGRQIGDMIALHSPGLNRHELRQQVIGLLTQVGIAEPEARHDAYPHMLSGGMRQRAMIAMAMAHNPALLIADEPTTALDVTIQAQVLDLLRTMRSQAGSALILVTHDLGVVAENADRVAIMYSGRIVETGPVGPLFANPRHPYTQGLLKSLLKPSDGEVYAIPGAAPAPAERPSGCAFHPRCERRRGRAICAEQIPLLSHVADGQEAACFFPNEPRVGHAAPPSPKHAPTDAASPAARRPQPIAEIQDVTVRFALPRRHPLERRREVTAVKDVTFAIAPGETLGLVGESGSGKTTLIRTILGLQAPTRGEVLIEGRDLARMTRSERRAVRPKMQMVFQDPYSSLDPKMTVHDIVAEPLRINRRYTRARVGELLELVGMSLSVGDRYPADFSGGQRQRISIARALALNPDLLILDEPLSALDLSVQAQVINVLTRLQDELGLTYLFVAHDLAAVRHLSDRVAVMYLGRLIELGTRDQVFNQPLHPYTRALMAAAPIADPEGRAARRRVAAIGEGSAPSASLAGCDFRWRCPIAQTACAAEAPPFSEVTPGHRAACWRPEPQRATA